MGGPGRIVSQGGDSAHRTLRNNVNSKWIHDPGLWGLDPGIALMFSSAVANGFDGKSDEWSACYLTSKDDLETISISILDLIIASTSLSESPSFISASYISDLIGRPYTVAISLSIILAASTIQATAAPLLTTEIMHPKHRGQVRALFKTVWYWGAIISTCITLGTLSLSNSWNWRVPFTRFASCPESPRGPVSKGRREEALNMLAKYLTNGNVNEELAKFMSFFETQGNRHRSLICVLVDFMIQWVGNGIISYYLALILESVGITSTASQAGINLGMQVWNALLAVLGALVISACGVFAEHHITAAGSAVVAFHFIFFGFPIIAFPPLSIAYPVEILPFRLRSKDLSVNLTVWKFYFVYVANLTSMVFIIYFGLTLEEIAMVFEGEEAGLEVNRRLSVGILQEKEEPFSNVSPAEKGRQRQFMEATISRCLS
ncbi:hypothetical protein K469DRAFT_743519 [Zopfia rhizophila CBS 207.26]|uniref:MFS general substrate transporter n=1 Tax=Zopfia rhizophila CBS 207.26 TaxID=1314779 RepID=A0A6A6DBC9_9PEZI|nr:hypothetical protein K469DRAFT_743519 [Zopfia rhizophila CBS 207.26]